MRKGAVIGLALSLVSGGPTYAISQVTRDIVANSRAVPPHIAFVGLMVMAGVFLLVVLLAEWINRGDS